MIKQTLSGITDPIEVNGVILTPKALELLKSMQEENHCDVVRDHLNETVMRVAAHEEFSNEIFENDKCKAEYFAMSVLECNNLLRSLKVERF